jgi:hypothetical protein
LTQRFSCLIEHVPRHLLHHAIPIARVQRTASARPSSLLATSFLGIPTSHPCTPFLLPRLARRPPAPSTLVQSLCATAFQSRGSASGINNPRRSTPYFSTAESIGAAPRRTGPAATPFQRIEHNIPYAFRSTHACLFGCASDSQQFVSEHFIIGFGDFIESFITFCIH